MSAEETDEARARRDEELEKQITKAVKIGVPVLTVILAGLGGVFVDVSTAILVLAAGALVGVIAMFWASLRTLLGETPLSGADAYAFGAPPRAEEEQKRAVLRALKDLEFERSVGKISEEDYQALVAKYRAEAKRLLQLLDEEAGPRRERAEALVIRRLRKEGLLDMSTYRTSGLDGTNLPDVPDDEETETGAEAEAEAETETAAEAVAEAAADAEAAAAAAAVAPKAAETPRKTKKKKKAKKPAPKVEEKAEASDEEAEAASVACASCGTTNDEDALFCKKCGARLSAEQANQEEADAS